MPKSKKPMKGVSCTGHKSLEAYQQYIKLDPHSVMGLVKNIKTDNSGIKLAQTL
jgi:hypothetical protein